MDKDRLLKIGGLFLVFSALILAIGCESQMGGKAGQGVKKSGLDPMDTCSLLKKEEVEAVIKQKVQDLEPQKGYCQYWSREPKDISFSITAASFDSSAWSLKDMKKAMERDAQSHGQLIKQAEGFGNDAFYQIVPAENTTYLHLIKGKYYFIFETRLDKKDSLPGDALKSLAMKALDRV